MHKRRTFKIDGVANFDTENFFVLNFKSKKNLSIERKQEIYNKIKSQIEGDYNFKLITGLEEMFIHRNKIEYNEYREQCIGK